MDPDQLKKLDEYVKKIVDGASDVAPIDKAAVKGIIVPQDIIENPETINVGRIELEENAEIRRVLIERFGAERFILDSGAYLMDADYCGNLYSKWLSGDEPLVMVEVTNSTPEPDGTLKRYYLRVPPDVTSAREAVAWTFGMREEEYFPLVET